MRGGGRTARLVMEYGLASSFVSNLVGPFPVFLRAGARELAEDGAAPTPSGGRATERVPQEAGGGEGLRRSADWAYIESRPSH